MRSALCFFLLTLSILAGAEDFTIQTFAGGGLPQNMQGTSAVFQGLGAIVSDANGNAYFVTSSHTVMRLDQNGVVTLVAGNGTPGYSGDGGLATNAQLNQPAGIALDGAGSLYIADYGNARVRKVQNGVISTIAGGGSQTSENVPAVDTLLTEPTYVAADAAGNVYVEDPGPNFYGPATLCCRIRKIVNGMISTIAGNGTFGYSGDRGPATSAQLAGPGGMAVDAAGTLYFADSGGIRASNPPISYANIRKIQNGVITTVVPNVAPTIMASDSAGNLFIADGAIVEEISNGVVTTVAGTPHAPQGGGNGDNGPAIDAYLGGVGGLSVDKDGDLLLTSPVSPAVPIAASLIRKISNGVITTIAGSAGTPGVSMGDGGPPTGAQLFLSGAVAMDAAGDVYIAESSRIRKISQGAITTVVGTGIGGFSGDNGPAIDAQIGTPQGIGVDAAGNLYIADTSNLRVRKVSNGIITTIAGNGIDGYTGDGGPAVSAGVYPQALAVSPAGDVYVSQHFRLDSYVVRKISNGTIVTVAGNTTHGYTGDGPATQVPLNYPTGLALDQAGNLYIADTFNQLIRKVSNGMMTTVAGSLGAPPGSSGGDGGLATNAQLNFPNTLAVDALGRLYIGEGLSSQKNAHVRRVSNGIITTVAGSGTWGFSGDGGPAVGASISPAGLAIGPNGQVYEADFLPSRVRVLTPAPIPGVSFSANPTAVPTIAGSTVGQTTLSWNAPGYGSLQIFANGALFDDVGTSGSVATGTWVGNGMNFSLVDPATWAPLSTVTVHTTAASSGGQLTFTANPNPITLAAGASVGKTTLNWNAPGYSGLQIWVNGVLFDAGLPASGSVDTGNWVGDGTSFSLVDSASNHAIAKLTMHTAAMAPTGQVTFTANPNPLALATGASVGMTTLSWSAPGYSGLQIWVDGVLFDAGLPASGSVDTGNWVGNGTSFALINPSNQQTIATVTVAAK